MSSIGIQAPVSSAPAVAILMGTYNGAAYLRQQVDSVQAQSFPNWRLLVRDDGSSDGTQGLLDQLAGEDPRIEIVRDDRGNVGVARNFGFLMEHAAQQSAPYYMFADQDDVWHADKIERLLAEIQRVEAEHGSATPVLVHSDLEVVDATLRSVHPSFFQYQRISHQEQVPLRVLPCQNFVTGCATLFNRSLLLLATPAAAQIVMHDWWLALLAAAAGRITCVEEATVRYRQHGENQVGAKSLWHEINPLRSGFRERVRRGNAHFLLGIAQAGQAALRLQERDLTINAEALELLLAYAGLPSCSRLQRLRLIGRLGVGPQNVLRRLSFWTRTMRLRRS
jgi:rhamnosyltransferase